MSSISTSYRELLQHRRDPAVCGPLLAAIGAGNRANSIPRVTLCMDGRPGEPDAIGPTPPGGDKKCLEVVTPPLPFSGRSNCLAAAQLRLANSEEHQLHRR